MYRELEFKYQANNIGLKRFKTRMEKIGYTRHITVGGTDIFYTNEEGHFIRYRFNGDWNELTIKRKDKGLADRIEVNIRLLEGGEKLVSSFVELLGYTEEFRISKHADIYYDDKLGINTVYYTVFDEDLKELDRFIEIEWMEEDVTESAEHVIMKLTEYEKKFKLLGITPRNRCRKSLFERYRRREDGCIKKRKVKFD